MPPKKADDRDGALDRHGPAIPVPSAGVGRIRHLRRGNPTLNQERRPPRELRIRRAVDLVLGEHVGGLVNDLLDEVRAGKLPPHVARVMLDRLPPPPPPLVVDIGLPPIRTPDNLRRSQDLIIAAINDGRISPSEARELQGSVMAAWRARDVADTVDYIAKLRRH